MYHMTLQRPEMNSQGQIVPTRVSLTSSPPQELLIGQLLRNVRVMYKCTCNVQVRNVQVRVKPDHLEKFKINISTRRIKTKFCTRKRLNTESILHI